MTQFSRQFRSPLKNKDPQSYFDFSREYVNPVSFEQLSYTPSLSMTVVASNEDNNEWRCCIPAFSLNREVYYQPQNESTVAIVSVDLIEYESIAMLAAFFMEETVEKCDEDLIFFVGEILIGGQ